MVKAAGGLQPLLPIRLALWLFQRQRNLLGGHGGRAGKWLGAAGEQSAHLGGDALAVLPGDVEVAAGLRADVRAAADGYERNRLWKMFLHRFICVTGPVAAHPVGCADGRTMTGIIGPHCAHAAFGIARGQHWQAVVHRPAALETESGPLAVVEHPPIAAEAHAALRPVQLHRLTRL